MQNWEQIGIYPTVASARLTVNGSGYPPIRFKGIVILMIISIVIIMVIGLREVRLGMNISDYEIGRL